MKILHVNKFFDLFGGAETVLHATIERQRQLGHEVHAFSTRAPANLPSEDSRFFVTRYDYAHQEGAEKDVKKSLSYLWNREARRSITRMIAEIRPDVIHIHNIYHHLSTSVLAPIRASGIPCVQTLHDYKLACPNYRMFTEGAPCERCKGGRYYEAVKHHCLTPFAAGNVLAAAEMGMTKIRQSYERTVRVFICPSNFMKEKMIAWGEPASKMFVIPNAVEIPPNVVSRDGGYILAAGRLSIEKGIETLVRAAARDPRCRVKIAGTGPEEARLRSLAATLGASNVEFLGFVRKAEHQDIWNRAAAFAQPSLSYDNAPLSVLEAMAAGIPILGSRIGGIPEMVNRENGFLIEPGDDAEWAETIRSFLDLTPEEKTRMGEASRKRVTEKFTWEKHLASLFDVYRMAGASDR